MAQIERESKMAKYHANTELRTYGSSCPATVTQLPNVVKRKKRYPRKIISDILLVAEGGTTWGPGLHLSAEESAIAIRYLQKKIKRLENKTIKQIGKQGETN
jgi:hypothetical protein